VVLIHGLGLNFNMWQWQVDDLASRYRVIRYDLPGHGQTPPPSDGFTMQVMMDQLVELLDEADVESCALAGFSLGGLIAQWFALNHGDRLDSLAILHAAHNRTDAMRAAIMQRVRQAEKEGPAATVNDALARWFSESFAKSRPDVLAQVKEWVTANDPEVYPGAYRLLADGDAGIEEDIRHIQCPTLVMTGEEDYGNSPQMAEAMAALIPNAECVVLPGLRHMAMAEDPALVNAQLLSFLDKHSGVTS
jgi:pimeloyl-ACP methyl ester carboxylesterase